ncbi:MAG: LacI family DNA-binding transcriptional regulator [Melioribacteraceae bacterium]|nr:LacI family DNA-binding transcriptional regulator [Melioribacteraceae bacterium]
MNITLVDIAKKAGLSVSTVSRILNGQQRKYRISDKSANLVFKVAEELNYKPNALARGLRLKKTHTLGLVVPDISNPFFAFITRIIQLHAHNNGYSLIVCNTDENIESEVEQVNLLISKGVDGFIIMPVGTQSDHIEYLINNELPVVLLDRTLANVKAGMVLVDNFKGSYDATQHLINKGHTAIAIVLGLRNTSTTNERLEGYKQALIDNGIEINEKYIVGNDFRIETGYIETKFLVNLEKPPTAIFATSDIITVGALKALAEENLKIPDDISLVAFDDTDFAPYLSAPLTVVKQPKELMGEIAVKLLIEEIQNGHDEFEKPKIILKPKLVIRNSVVSVSKPVSI